jgi:hypothetical protein
MTVTCQEIVATSGLFYTSEVFIGRQDRFALHSFKNHFELIHHEQRFNGLFRERVETLLTTCDFVGILRSKIVRFRWILREVIEFNFLGQERVPHEFPVAFSHRAAEWLDVVDDLGARRRFAFCDSVPDVDAIERLAISPWAHPQGLPTSDRGPPHE